MFNLIFGLVWTIFSTFCFSLMFVDGGNFEPAIIPFALLFEGVGIWLIVSGLKQVITNKKTDIHGISTYGIVLNTLKTGSYVNNVPELKAEVLTYLEYERTTKVFQEIIGLAPAKYNVGAYVSVKQHENDINIIEEVDRDTIPNYILESLEEEYFNEDAPKTIEVNGVTYVRADLIEGVDLNEKF